MDLMIGKYRFGKERYVKQINNIGEGREKQRGKVMSENNQGLQHTGIGRWK